MATESSREARRKRILDQGSDRLAIITGKARSLPPFAISTPSPPPHPKLGGGGGEEPLPDAVGSAGDDVATGYELPKCEPNSASVRDTIDRSANIETFLQREKNNGAVAIIQVQDNNGQIEPVTTCGSHNQVVNNKSQQAKRQIDEMFTAKRISSSISASENIRLLCATFIALMVVLSYHGYPLGIGSIISFRPIFLVFLTDATLVVGILFTAKWEVKDEADPGTTTQESKDWTDQIGKTLEAVLASQKAATALFLDCSLCAGIIVCGASFSQKP